MCPVCWATAAATFATLCSVALVFAAGRDWRVRMLAGANVLLYLLNRFGSIRMPWWAYAGLMVLIFARFAAIAGVLLKNTYWQAIWCRAHAVAKSSCPRRQRKPTTQTEKSPIA